MWPPVSGSRRGLASTALFGGIAVGIRHADQGRFRHHASLCGRLGRLAIWVRRSAILLAVAIPLISLLTLTPWIVRNYRVFGEFIPLATEGGDTLLGGNNSVVAYNPEYYGHQNLPNADPGVSRCLRLVFQRSRTGSSGGQFGHPLAQRTSRPVVLPDSGENCGGR